MGLQSKLQRVIKFASTIAVLVALTFLSPCRADRAFSSEIKGLDKVLQTTRFGRAQRRLQQSSPPAPAGPTGQATCPSLSLQVAGSQQSFSTCQTLSGIAYPFQLLWTLQNPGSSPIAGSGNDSIVQVGITAVYNGWAAIGFPQAAGNMVPAEAVIVKRDASSPSGAIVENYHLGGYYQSLVQPANTLLLSNTAAEWDAASGQLRARFTLALPGGPAAEAQPYPMIWAVGPLDSSGAVAQHPGDGYSPGTINYATGASQLTTSTSPDHYLQVLHAWMSAIGFGILIPAGIFISRVLKETDPVWFHLHYSTMLIGVGLGVAGFGIGIHIGDDFRGQGNSTHRTIGITIVVLTGILILLGVFRAARDSRWRSYWSAAHQWLGRAAAALAVANVYIGLGLWEKWDGSATKGYWAYSVVLAVIAIAGFAKEGVDRCLPSQTLRKNKILVERGIPPLHWTTTRGKTVDKSITNIELPAVSYNVAEVETLDCNENQC